jgi:hypothetical protein
LGHYELLTTNRAHGREGRTEPRAWEGGENWGSAEVEAAGEIPSPKSADTFRRPRQGLLAQLVGSTAGLEVAGAGFPARQALSSAFRVIRFIPLIH